ncbi:MAG TPA: hypothetical protein VJ044_06120 [Candidatus Hodarchaeales archaeon]|nr:hypothetical protein [Candidatus Hodarchaeales archaeon]
MRRLAFNRSDCYDIETTGLSVYKQTLNSIKSFDRTPKSAGQFCRWHSKYEEEAKAGSIIGIGRSNDKSDTPRVSKRSWPKKILGVLLVLLGSILTLQFLLTTWPSDIMHAAEVLAQDISLFGFGFFLVRLVISPGALASIFILMMIGGIRLIQKQR